MRYFNTYLLVITANALKYKYTRLREYITVSDVVTCIGVITPVYYPSLVFLADKSRDFLGLEMYAYEHTSSTKNAGTHTHTRKRECTPPWDARNGKKKAKFANAASHDT